MKVPHHSSGATSAAQDRVTRLALGYLSRQDRSVVQLSSYLSRRGASEAHIVQVVQRLRRLGYLNDEVLVRRWADAKLSKSPMGSARLQDELLAKGFDEADVSAAVAELYRERPERHWAELLVGEGRRQRPATPWATLIRRLRQRGFDEDVIRDVVERAGVDHDFFEGKD